MDADTDMDTISRTTPKQTLMTLPPELHLLISRNLTYPDALSLKHVNQHFRTLVYTGVNLKIEWLIERRQLHLDCPNNTGCELGSDLRFCRGSVRLLMKRRREHGECETRDGGRGCLVFGTAVCTLRKEEAVIGQATRWGRGVMERTAVFWWILVAVVGVVVGLTWMRMGPSLEAVVNI